MNKSTGRFFHLVPSIFQNGLDEFLRSDKLLFINKIAPQVSASGPVALLSLFFHIFLDAFFRDEQSFLTVYLSFSVQVIPHVFSGVFRLLRCSDACRRFVEIEFQLFLSSGAFLRQIYPVSGQDAVSCACRSPASLLSVNPSQMPFSLFRAVSQSPCASTR